MSKKHYIVNCYTCQHNGQETCRGCKTFLVGDDEPYENWQLREDLEQKDNKIANLEAKLAEYECLMKKYNVEDLWHLDIMLFVLSGETKYQLAQLKQQLAEKDAENKKLKNIVDGVDKLKQFNVDVDEFVLINPNNIYTYGNKLVVKSSEQDKISLAVDKLKKLKDRLSSMQWCFTGRRNFLQEVEFMRKSQEEMIDEEIEELLKEMKSE